MCMSYISVSQTRLFLNTRTRLCVCTYLLYICTDTHTHVHTRMTVLLPCPPSLAPPSFPIRICACCVLLLLYHVSFNTHIHTCTLTCSNTHHPPIYTTHLYTSPTYTHYAHTIHPHEPAPRHKCDICLYIYTHDICIYIYTYDICIWRIYMYTHKHARRELIPIPTYTHDTYDNIHTYERSLRELLPMQGVGTAGNIAGQVVGVFVCHMLLIFVLVCNCFLPNACLAPLTPPPSQHTHT